LLRLEAKRNMANIGRQTGVDEQALRHFMSESSWDGRAVIEMLQAAVAERAELAGGVLILDESGEGRGRAAPGPGGSTTDGTARWRIVRWGCF
jgi:hypothetical protein